MMEKSTPCFGVLAALPAEGERLLARLKLSRTICCGSLKVLAGSLAGKRVFVAFSGLGKTNAAAAAAALLARFRVSHLWMWGSGGLYPQSDAGLTELALASEEIMADEGVATLSSWRSLEAMGLPLAATREGPVYNRIPVDQTAREQALLLLRQRSAGADRQPRVHLGPFLTVSAASGSRARARQLQRRFGGLCENMEGAGAALVCLGYGVPFLEIRGLSNWAGDRHKQRWHLEEALVNCQEAVLYLLAAWQEMR